jgi:hypothetical protein
MKSLFVLISMSLLLSNCKGQTKTEDKNEEIKKESMNNSIKNNLYSLGVTSSCSHDLYINDIGVKINGTSSGSYITNINDFVLKKGTYKIKAIFYTNPAENQMIDNTKITFISFYKNQGNKKLNTLTEIKNLPIPSLVSTKPTTIIKEWEVELIDLPYTLEGWSKSKVFKEKDSLEIKPKVVAFYENLRSLLNDGNGEAFNKFYFKQKKELLSYGFETIESINKGNLDGANDIDKYAKNSMVPLEDYELKIYADGQLVCLERKGNKKEINMNTRGWSPLFFNNKGYISEYSIFLHMPENSTEFEIIRSK